MTAPSARLAEIKARAEAATGLRAIALRLNVREADAVFIAYARADVTWLLAEVERLRAALETAARAFMREDLTNHGNAARAALEDRP